MILRKGKYGQFYGCSSYPECQFTKSFVQDTSQEEDIERAREVISNIIEEHEKAWRTRSFRERIAEKKIYILPTSVQKVNLVISFIIGTNPGERIANEYIFSARKTKNPFKHNASWFVNGEYFVEVKFIRMVEHQEHKSRRKLISTIKYWGIPGEYQEDHNCKFGFSHCSIAHDTSFVEYSFTEVPLPVVLDVLGFFSTHGLWKGDWT